MMFSEKVKNTVVLVVSYLYILLFVYAAMSKLLDFENFRIQLGQSPILSIYASFLSWFVPVFELLLALFLTVKRFRFWALFVSLLLMNLFTSYIYILLNFSADIPCSCGGVLEQLGWTEHLFFNLFYIVLAIIALSFLSSNYLHQYFFFRLHPFRKTLFFTVFIPFATLVCFVLVWFFFQSTEETMSAENPFIRKFTTRPVEYSRELELGYNSYYIAGYAHGTIYLGNYTAPLHVLAIDTLLQTKKEHTIEVDLSGFSVRSFKLSMDKNRFYLSDGTVPLVATGRINDWKGTVVLTREPYFSKLQPIDSTHFVFRGISSKTRENILGTFRTDTHQSIKTFPHLLEKQTQTDGLFDTDGHLTYSSELSKMVYVYAYRNEYIVAEPNGTLAYRGKTIDTVSKAQIKVTTTHQGKVKTPSDPPLLVNGSALAYRHLLIVDSRLRGAYEQASVSKRVRTFDVYDLKKNTYLLSFYIPALKNKKPHSFFITDHHFLVLIDQKLVVYDLKNLLLKALNSS